MWIKSGQPEVKKPEVKAKPSARAAEVHVPHHVEADISAFLVQKGRLEMRLGRQLLHFVNMSRNGDGSIDYLVRTRTHSTTGAQRDHESHVRLLADNRLKLIR